jgi:hypothetical protein
MPPKAPTKKPRVNAELNKMRDTISELLFKHKEEMPDGVYKELYESLKVSSTIDQKWCRVTYVKATHSKDEDGDIVLSQDMNKRNVVLDITTIAQLNSRIQKHGFAYKDALINYSPHHKTCGCNSCHLKEHQFEEMIDEPFMFCPTDESYMILKVDVLDY